MPRRPFRIGDALREAGIVLEPGGYVTAAQYERLPQWFKDEVASQTEELIAQLEQDGPLPGDTDAQGPQPGAPTADD